MSNQITNTFRVLKLLFFSFFILSALMVGNAAANALNISKDDGLGMDECVSTGKQLTYSICYDNTASESGVNNVIITDTLPAPATYISSDNNGTYDDVKHEVTWSFDYLDAGAEQTCAQLVVEVTASPGAFLINTVTIDSDETEQAEASKQTSVCPVPVSVDIKPGGCPTPVNVGSQGVLPVAVLGTADFDVTTIDPASITLAGVPLLRWSLEDVGTPYELNMQECNIDDCHELEGDGYNDLTLKFDTQEVAAAIGEVTDRDCLHIELLGKLKAGNGGATIRGFDVVSILKKGKKIVAPTNTLLLRK